MKNYNITLAATFFALIAASCAWQEKPYTIPDFNAQQISCTDSSTRDARQNAESVYANVKAQAAVTQPGSPEEKKLTRQLLQTSKALADSGNPNGMGFFGDALRTEIILAYLDQIHVTNKRQAPSVTLPPELHTNVVTALSYLYIAANAGGDPEEKAQSLIASIEKRAVKAHDLPSNYVHVPHTWIAEAKANAKAWKKGCK